MELRDGRKRSKLLCGKAWLESWPLRQFFLIGQEGKELPLTREIIAAWSRKPVFFFSLFSSIYQAAEEVSSLFTAKDGFGMALAFE